MKWITRERVKVDRVACPWLITKFIDKDAEFLFVPSDQVIEVAEREGATRMIWRRTTPSGSSTTRSMPIARRWSARGNLMVPSNKHKGEGRSNQDEQTERGVTFR